MRKTEAARYARWSVTVAILMALGVAGVYAWRAMESGRALTALPPPVPAAVQQHSAEFSYSKVVGNNTRFIVRASNATEFKERGRTLLDDVWITTFGGNGKRADQLRTASCEFLADSGIVSCPQQVSIDLQGSAASSTGGNEQSVAAHPVHVVTSHLNFNRGTGVATTEDPVEFQFADGEGHALGLIYDSDRGELHLLHNVEMVFRSVPSSATSGPSSAPGAPMAVSGDELTYRRDEHFIHLNGSARMRRDRQELQAGLITMELDQELKARRLLASDHPILHNPATDTDVTLAADELEAPLNAAGQMQSVAANGHVSVDALRSDGRHHLTASTGLLELISETQQPRHFSAAGNVDVTSRAPDGAQRRLQTPQLEVYFTAGTGGDSRMDRATAANGNIDWESPAATSAKSSGASAETMKIKGEFLDSSFDAAGVMRELRGKGDVEVQKQTAGESPTTSTSKELLVSVGPDGMWTTMDQTGDVHLKNATGDARGDRARFNRAEDTINLAGNVVISDDSSQTRAQTAVYRQSQGELRAEGNVFTTETPKDKSSGVSANSDPTHITSERMVSQTQTGHALYSGKARMWQGDSAIQADTIDLDRRESTLVAVGKVKAVFPQAQSSGATQPGSHAPNASKGGYWHAEAGRLTYEQGQSRARLEQNARATSTDGSVQADRLDLFLAQQGGGKASGQAAPVRRASLESSLEGQQVQRAQGLGRVRVDSGDRTGTGERGDYSAADGKFILSGGHPAIIDKFGNTTAGRQLTFFFADDRIVVDSEEGSRTLTLHRVEK
jgi:lipopolysaccharide export system protein LptA